ncbi:HAD family hydrolase [Microbulbifer sp. SA54]|uniref:HAD family hydrolase n=1 Tax=Microbulbifer sp. SA54 TaxID=3401577 RepID=UPI003AAAC242
MPNYEWLLFDLDGTLSDPAEGFVNSMNYALVAHDFAPRESGALTPHIGPPLEQTVAHLIGSGSASLVNSMLSSYRERYGEIGYTENALYPGIAEMLETLSRSNDIRLAVCTSKRADFACKIIERFDLQHYFEFVSGGDVGIAKWQQLKKLLVEERISSRTLMIGDRHFDITAAHRNGMDSAGVLWGYGSEEELNIHRPKYLFSYPHGITSLFSRKKHPSTYIASSTTERK